MTPDQQQLIEELAHLEGALPGDTIAGVEELHADSVSAATAGIWRVSVADGSGIERRTLILKVLHSSTAGHRYWPSSTDEGNPMYWRREADAFESGILAKPYGPGIRAPHCFGVIERQDDSVALWLEDVGGTPGMEWTADDYARFIRHLGRAQADWAQPGRLPTQPWLSRSWLREYMERREPIMADIGSNADWNQPIFRSAFPRSLRSMTEEIWAHRDIFLDLLESGPQTLCHLDAWPRNLFRSSTAGPDEFVVIDWAFVGIGAIGEDPGNILPDSMFDLFLATDPPALSTSILENYLLGLNEGGWRGSEDAVRFAYAASASLKYVWLLPQMVQIASDPIARETQEEEYQRPFEEIVQERAGVLYLLENLFKEATSLARGGSIP